MVDWDAKWAAGGGDAGERLYGSDPNAYLAACFDRMGREGAPRSALCLADGDGRNGAWLAGQGVVVTAVDLSAVATEQAQAHDKALGVAPQRIVADAAAWRPGPGETFDLFALFFLHCPAEMRLRAFRTGLEAVGSGGWCVLEGFARAQASGSMGPKNPDLLYEVDRLAAEAEAAGFTVIEALEGRVRLDEGPLHRGEAITARLLARRSRR